MAARNKPAGIRSLVYGIGKGKVRIEGLSVLSCIDIFHDQLPNFLTHGRRPNSVRVIQITRKPTMGSNSFQNENYESIPLGVSRYKQMTVAPQKKSEINKRLIQLVIQEIALNLNYMI